VADRGDAAGPGDAPHRGDAVGRAAAAGRGDDVDGGTGIVARRIPEATVVRLPVYQRILAELLRSGTDTVPSEQLALLARVTAAKVRKDLSYLGTLGTRGAGYEAAVLIEEIDRALGLDQEWPMAIVGLGNLGHALANSGGFASHGFKVVALFDVDPQVVGSRVADLRVRHLDELVSVAAEEDLTIGVITTPASSAQGVADLLVRCGVCSILNFAPRVLTVPPDVLLRYVDLSVELQVMSFYQSRRLLRSSRHPRPLPALRSISLPGQDIS